MRFKTLALAGMAMTLTTGAAQAHHSFALFDHSKTIELTGLVKDYQWTNPHVWIELVVPNAQGGSDEWPIESASVAVLSRRGWDRNTVKPGDKITVTVNPLRDGTRGGSLVNIRLPDGRSLAVIFS
jgi:hypothetical protein